MAWKRFQILYDTKLHLKNLINIQVSASVSNTVFWKQKTTDGQLTKVAEIDISVSRLLPIFLGFLFGRIWSRKKSVGFRKFSLEKVLVLENLVLKKKYRFGSREFGLGKKYLFRIIWSRKKSIGFDFGKFGIGTKVSVSVSVKILSSFTE